MVNKNYHGFNFDFLYFYIGACVEILVTEDTFSGIYFQDKEMNEIFASYPEFLCIDATYKLLELRFPVYLMLIEDGNGQSEIIAVFLLAEETKDSVMSVIDIFKKHNPNWDSIRIIMSDKDFTERDVFAALFPRAQTLICLFHTLQTFRREITMEKMGISAAQRSTCLDYVQKMAYCTNDEQYKEVYSQFAVFAPSQVLKYFDTQWHSITSQWVIGMKHTSGNFLNATNNRLECINSKLKSVISRYSSLEQFIDKFFLILKVMRDERNHKAIMSTLKVPVLYHSNNPVLVKYINLLTSYAFKHLERQMSLMKEVKEAKSTNLLLDVHDDCQQFEVECSAGTIMVSASSCQCASWLSMKLPCRHIFSIREKLGLDLYDEGLCDKRWLMSYYKSCRQVFNSNTDDYEATENVSPIVSEKRRKVLSQVMYFINSNDYFLISINSRQKSITFCQKQLPNLRLWPLSILGKIFNIK